MNGYPAEGQGCGYEGQNCCPDDTAGVQCNIGLLCSNEQCTQASQVKAGNGCGKSGEQCCTTEPNCIEGGCLDGKCSVIYMNGYPAKGQGCGYEGQNCCPDDTAGVPCNIGLLCSNEKCTQASQVKASEGCGMPNEPCCQCESSLDTTPSVQTQQETTTNKESIGTKFKRSITKMTDWFKNIFK